jgi:hypothetical protein
MAFSICPTIIINGIRYADVKLVEIWSETDRHYPYRAEITYADDRQVRYLCAGATWPERTDNGLLGEPEYELTGAVQATPLRIANPYYSGNG